MEDQLTLNRSSSIVQRVLELRNARAQENTEVGFRPEVDDMLLSTIQTRTTYQQQMWQKSDLFVVGYNAEHRCSG